MLKSGKIVRRFASLLTLAISSTMEGTKLTKNNVVISNMGSVERSKSVFLYGEFLVAGIAKVRSFPVSPIGANICYS